MQYKLSENEFLRLLKVSSPRYAEGLELKGFLTLGELLALVPKKLKIGGNTASLTLSRNSDNTAWTAFYESGQRTYYLFVDTELMSAIFKMYLYLIRENIIEPA